MSNAVSSREAARAIIRQTRGGMHLQKSLDNFLIGSSLPRSDAQFLTDLCYGYFRTLPRLQFIIGKFLTRPDKLPAEMLVILQIAVYSLLFQDSVPAFAAINEAVKSVKKLWGDRLARVANGALRAIDRESGNLKNLQWYIDQCGDQERAFAIFHAVPATIANLWLKNYGLEIAVKLMARSFSRPFAGVRLNRSWPDFKNLKEKISDCADAVAIGEYGFALPPGKLPEYLRDRGHNSLFATGAFTFQSPGSLVIIDKLKLSGWTAPVWDACSGIGGKSAPLAEAGLKIGLATDTSMARLVELPDFFRRLGLAPPPIVLANAVNPPLARWDGDIIVDAPCSGLGVLGRRPDIKASHIDFQAHVRTQKAILASTLKLLAPGRELAYITCTLNPDENEAIINGVTRSDFTIVRQWQTPHDHPWLEGMFGAVLRRI